MLHKCEVDGCQTKQKAPLMQSKVGVPQQGESGSITRLELTNATWVPLWPAPHPCWGQKLFVSLHTVLPEERFHSLDVWWQVDPGKEEWQAHYSRAQRKILHRLGEQDTSCVDILTSQTYGFARHYRLTLSGEKEMLLSILPWTKRWINTQRTLVNKHTYCQ